MGVDDGGLEWDKGMMGMGDGGTLEGTEDGGLRGSGVKGCWGKEDGGMGS